MACIDRLTALRPDLSDLGPYQRELRRGLEACLDEEVEFSPSERSTFWLGPELSRGDDELRYIVNWGNTYNDGTVLMSIRSGALRPSDNPVGTSELGPILAQVEYVFGADLLAVRDAGLRLSWPAACWLHGAAREALVALHHANGRVHGNLRPERIRFALFRSERESDPFDAPSPLRFLNARNEHGGEDQRARELSVLARAIAELTTYPDPAIDQLLHAPADGSEQLLRNLLIEHGEPIDQLLLDRVNVGLALAPLPDNVDIDIELVALWRTVIGLEPMIDPSVPSAWARKPELETSRSEPLTVAALAAEAELRRRIVDRPDDPTSRLALADLLIERGDVRGELIRLRHELDTLPLDEQTRQVRETREQELVAKHGWRLAGEITNHVVGFELVGGFVDAVMMSAGQFREHGVRLFAAQPIRKLRLRPWDDDAIASLALAPNLRTLRALELGGRRGYIHPLKLAPLHGARLDRLEELEFQLCRLDDHDEVVLANLAAPNLRALWLHGTYLSGRALRGLAANRNLSDSLEILWCSLVGDTITHSAGTAVSPELCELADQAFAGLRMPRLRRISFTSCWFASDARVAALLRGAPELTTFQLDNETGPEMLDAVARCRNLERLLLTPGIGLDLLGRLLALPRLSVLQLQAQSVDHLEQVTERLLALPTTHPLRHVRFVGYYQPIADLQRRFPWSEHAAEHPIA